MKTLKALPFKLYEGTFSAWQYPNDTTEELLRTLPGLHFADHNGECGAVIGHGFSDFPVRCAATEPHLHRGATAGAKRLKHGDWLILRNDEINGEEPLVCSVRDIVEYEVIEV